MASIIMLRKQNINKKIVTALSICGDLLVLHGLKNWSIKLNNKTLSCAETWHNDKIISISKKFIIVSTIEEFKYIILHEIAHAKLGKGYGHGQKFIETCRSIGVKSRYIKESVDIPIKRKMLICNICNELYEYRNGEQYCRDCYENGIANKLSIKINEYNLIEWASTPSTH